MNSKEKPLLFNQDKVAPTPSIQPNFLSDNKNEEAKKEPSSLPPQKEFVPPLFLAKKEDTPQPGQEKSSYSVLIDNQKGAKEPKKVESITNISIDKDKILSPNQKNKFFDNESLNVDTINTQLTKKDEPQQQLKIPIQVKTEQFPDSTPMTQKVQEKNPSNNPKEFSFQNNPEMFSQHSKETNPPKPHEEVKLPFQ